MKTVQGEYCAGDQAVPIDEDHRFSTWELFPDDLKGWLRHFAAKNIPTAVGRSRLGGNEVFAIFLAKPQR